MEFLNNIWIALSTPNEGLVNILVLPLFFIENFLIMNLFIIIVNTEITKKQKLIYYLIFPLLSIVTMLFLPAPFNIFINYLFMFIFSNILFKSSIIKTSISILMAIIIFAIVGTLILNPFLTIFNIESSLLNTIPIYKFLFLLTEYFLVYIITLILKNINFQLTILDDIDKHNKNVILGNIFLGLLTLSIQLIITTNYTDILPLYITFLSFISLLAYLSISMYSFSRIMKLTITTKKLETTEEYNNTLKILHDNVRCFKHDFDNIVTTIGGYIRTNDMEGLKKYYLQLEDDCQKVNNLYVLNPEIVNNDGIYNLIVKKYNEAEQKNVKVNISFLLDLNTLKMKIYEFGRILGILLDNAIEASSECEEKIINLTFRNDTKNSRQLVKIENTYSNKNVDTEKIFEKGISEKENHTGLGLWEVNKLLHKNNNLALFTTKNDKYFSQQLEIYY